MPSPTYPATTYCPRCGTALAASPSPGFQVCPHCSWMAKAPPPTPPTPPTPSPGKFHVVTLTDMPDLEPPSPEEQAREALRAWLAAATGRIAAEAFDLAEPCWSLPLVSVYERIQEAHGALYAALGGRRMGEGWRPNPDAVRRAALELAVWQLVALRACEVGL